MAITTRAAERDEVIPKAAIIESELVKSPIIPAVVVMATVDEPWADLSMAAIMKGNSIPMPARVDAFCWMNWTNPASTITCPNTLPAAVMKIMGPAVLRLSWVME